MKSFRMLMLLAGVAGLVYAQSVSAEDAKPSAPEVKHHAPGGNPVEMLTKELNLTAEQQTQVKAIVDEIQPQRKALMDDQAMSKEDKGAKMKELRTTMNTKIRAVLTADQQKAFDEFNAKHQHGKGEHHKAPAAQ